jgi:alanyl-tRNA synthetase
VNVERRLLEEVSEALGGGDPAQAAERARKAVSRVKLLESELGKIRRAEQEREVAELVTHATELDGTGAVWVTRVYDGRSAEELREMALSVRGRLRGRVGAAVLGTANDGRALLVATCTNEAVQRGLSAAAILQDAATAIGGGAGGKGPVAFAGGPRPEALDAAVAAARSRFEALLAGA